MNLDKTVKSLERCGYEVKHFETGVQVVQYLEDNIENKTIGFGVRKL